jgi:hypothetical protein
VITSTANIQSTYSCITLTEVEKSSLRRQWRRNSVPLLGVGDFMFEFGLCQSLSSGADEIMKSIKTMFEVSTALKINVVFFWDVTLCSLVNAY